MKKEKKTKGKEIIKAITYISLGIAAGLLIARPKEIKDFVEGLIGNNGVDFVRHHYNNNLK